MKTKKKYAVKSTWATYDAVVKSAWNDYDAEIVSGSLEGKDADLSDSTGE